MIPGHVDVSARTRTYNCIVYGDEGRLGRGEGLGEAGQFQSVRVIPRDSREPKALT